MRIALLLTGHLRTYKIAARQLERYSLNGVQPDVFIGNWSSDEELCKSDFKEEIIYKLYKPKLYKCYDDLVPNINIDKKLYKADPNGTKSMFHIRVNLFNDFEKYCLEHNESYDVIIVSRFDVIPALQLNLNEQKFNKLIDGSIILFNGAYSSEFSGVSDMITIGVQSKIKVYLDFYYNIDKYIDEFIVSEKYLLEIIPEILLGRYINTSKIKYEHIDNALIVVRNNVEDSFIFHTRFRIINHLSSKFLYGDEILDLINNEYRNDYKEFRTNFLYINYPNIFLNKETVNLYFKIISTNEGFQSKLELSQNDRAGAEDILNSILTEIKKIKDKYLKTAYVELYLYLNIKYLKRVDSSFFYRLSFIFNNIKLALFTFSLKILLINLILKIRILKIKIKYSKNNYYGAIFR